MKNRWHAIRIALIAQFLIVMLFAFPLFINAPSTFLVIVGVLLLIASLGLAIRNAFLLYSGLTQDTSDNARRVVSFLRNHDWTSEDLDLIEKQLKTERKLTNRV